MYITIDSEDDVKGFNMIAKKLDRAIVLFTMDKCPYCEIMKPEWKAAVSSRKDVDALEVNARVYKKIVSKYPRFFEKMPVNGFPTMFFKDQNSAVLFTSPRTSKNITNFIDVNNGSKKITSVVYLRGPKKGKLKQGYRYVDGVPTKS